MQKDGPSRAGSDPVRPTYPIASVDNAMRLLLLFKEQRSIRLSEASSYLGVAHSTAHRLFAMLAYHDFVRQEPRTRAYVAGPALVQVGLAVVQSMDIRTQARPYLEELAARFNETVHLATLEWDKVRYLDAVESSKALRVAARTGLTLPAHCSALGKSLLATLTRDQLREAYPTDGPLPQETSRSVPSFAALTEELSKVREQGYATNNEESEDGVTSVAVALEGGHGVELAAISVAAPVGRMTAARQQEIFDALGETAQRLREAMP